MTFKEKLVILRKSKGLTQDEFASAVGVSRQAVYKWECGQSYPEVPKLLEMKLLFTISIDELLDDSYDIPVPEKKKRKRISKDAQKKIEESVEKEIKIPVAKVAPKAAAPKAEPAIAPEVKEEPKAAPEVDYVPKLKTSAIHIPKVEEIATEKVEVKVEEPKLEEVKLEEVKVENVAEANDEPAKKGGFFSLFRRK